MIQLLAGWRRVVAVELACRRRQLKIAPVVRLVLESLVHTMTIF